MTGKEDVIMATTETFVPGRLYNMPLADLQQDPNQPRKYIDPAALEELTASIREHRVIAPILFRVENGLFYIVAGERRCIAARQAGLTTIPAIFTDDPRYEEISLTENTIRADLTAVEEAEALDRLHRSRGCTQDELARIMGKTKASISQTLSLTRLPQALRDECRKDPSVPKRVLIEIAAKKQERSMLKAYQAYKASVNPVKKDKTGEAATEAQSAMKSMGATGKKIEALEPRNLYLEEKEALATAMNGLKGIIEIALAAITEPGTEETPEEEVSNIIGPDEMAEGDDSPETTPKKILS
jgi:ParB family transcriptional regulator, chromosome partitioning protein